MFQILNLSTGEKIFVDEPRYVRKDERNIWVRCNTDDAQCVAICGKRFSLSGKDTVDDAPQIVSVSPVDSTLIFNLLNNSATQNSGDISEIKTAIIDITDAVLDIYFNGLKGE